MIIVCHSESNKLKNRKIRNSPYGRVRVSLCLCHWHDDFVFFYFASSSLITLLPTYCRQSIFLNRCTMRNGIKWQMRRRPHNIHWLTTDNEWLQHCSTDLSLFYLLRKIFLSYNFPHSSLRHTTRHRHGWHHPVARSRQESLSISHFHLTQINRNEIKMIFGRESTKLTFLFSFCIGDWLTDWLAWQDHLLLLHDATVSIGRIHTNTFMRRIWNWYAMSAKARHEKITKIFGRITRLWRHNLSQMLSPSSSDGKFHHNFSLLLLLVQHTSASIRTHSRFIFEIL